VLAGGSGLEIAGLAYQFQRSRVHSVLASLWEVSDRATAELMARFYQELKGGQTYADALAATQRALVTGCSGLDHPGYWAPFVLMGTP
jgi:CHAT domain-containing protein